MMVTVPLVVLIHGLGRTSASMWLLAQQISGKGFQVIKLGYKSTSQGIEASIMEVRYRLASLKAGPLILVGHSMGGFIAAHILRDPKGLQIERVLQIGSPNLGSPLADRLGGVWPFRHLCGPALAELPSFATRKPSLPSIGSIGGTMGLPWIGLPTPHDGAVTLRSAWAGAGHHAAVSNLHTLLPLSPKVSRLAIRFITHGNFGDQR